jgi:hypothetical protein
MELTVQGYPVHRGGYVSKTVQAHAHMIKWQSGTENAPDQWLRALVARYLELFYIKRLEGHPSAEALPIVAESWIEDVGYNLTEADADRVTRGFMLLSRSIRKWPQPCELIKSMPGRAVSPGATSSKAEINEPETDHALASESLDNILNMFNDPSTSLRTGV